MKLDWEEKEEERWRGGRWEEIGVGGKGKRERLMGGRREGRRSVREGRERERER